MKQNQSILALLLFFVIGCNQKTADVILEAPEVMEAASPAIPQDDSVRIGTLENGMRYYIRQNAKPEDKVSLRLVINAGSILEDERQLGLAHFMEHMNFNGTKHFEKNELVDYLQTVGVKFGAHLNAYTSFDETVYMLPIPSDDEEILEKGLLILEDWAHGALLTDEEIEKERGVVLEEYRIGLGADKRMLENYIDKMMYGSMYAERLPIGTKEVLENFEPEELRRFYKDWYRPDLMAVVAVGDIDVDDMEKRIIAHFGKIAPASTDAPERKEFFVPDHEETFIAIETDVEAPMSQVQLMYKDPNPVVKTNTEEDFRNAMIRTLFTTMLINRLNELRNSPEPPFVYGYSYFGGTWSRNKNAFQSFAMTGEADQLQGLRALLEENERVKRFGFQQAEFDRAKEQRLAYAEKSYNERDKRESNQLMGTYVNHFLEGGALISDEWRYETYKRLLPTITLDDLQPLLDDFLQDENRVIIITGPEKDGLVKVTEEEVRLLLDEVAMAELQPYADESLGNSLMEAPESQATITSTEKNEALGTTTITLSNGVKVVYKQTDFKNDEVLLRAYSLGGNSLFSQEEYEKVNLAMSGLTDAGINGFSLNDLNKINTGKIVSVRPYVSGLSEGFSGSATPKDLETLFQMVYLYFTELNEDEEAFKGYITKQKSFYANLLSDPSFYFSDQINQFMNQNNPRYMGMPDEEDWDDADYSLAHDLFQERFADAGDFTFFFVGNFDEEVLQELAKTYFGSLPTQNSNENFVDLGIRPLEGSHTLTIEKGNEDKSMVRIMYRGEAEYSQEENYYLQSLGEILTIKLIEQLREEKGGVYGAGARGSMNQYPYGSYFFTISFPCGPENVEELTQAALDELEKIAEFGPTEKDLNKIKETQLLQYKENLKQNRYWLNQLYNKDYNQQDPNEILDMEARINALTAEDIQAVAKKYLSDNVIIGTLMPENVPGN